MTAPHKLLRNIRIWIILMMICIFLSGITAFPLETELKWFSGYSESFPPPMARWIEYVYEGVRQTNGQYPYMAYGTDWLAFAHIVIGLAFVGPLRDPVRNRWVIDWGLLCCIGVFPLALIAGPVRHIPFFHILIDCSFGVIGMIPLGLVRRWIIQLEKIKR